MRESVCPPPMDEDLPMPTFLNSVSCSTLLLGRPCATQLKGIENPARWIHESHYWSIRSLNDWINHHQYYSAQNSNCIICFTIAESRIIIHPEIQ